MRNWILLVLLMSFFQGAWGDIPMAIQGSITGPSGNAITHPTVEFKIYPTPTGGFAQFQSGVVSPVWLSQTNYVSKISNADSLFYYGKPQYLAVVLNGSELSRVPFQTVPYAFVAATAGTSLTPASGLNSQDGAVSIVTVTGNRVGVFTSLPSANLDVPSGSIHVSGSIYRKMKTLSVGSGATNPSIDWSQCGTYQLNFNLGSICNPTIQFSHPPNNSSELILIFYNSSASPVAGHTISWPNEVVWSDAAPSFPIGIGYTMVKLYYSSGKYWGRQISDLRRVDQ